MGNKASSPQEYVERVRTSTLRPDLDGMFFCIEGKQLSDIEIDKIKRKRQPTRTLFSESMASSFITPGQHSFPSPHQQQQVQLRTDDKQSEEFPENTMMTQSRSMRTREAQIDPKLWSVCLLEIFFQQLGIGNRRIFATGVLISDRHVLTAAHNVYDRANRQWPAMAHCKRVRAYPAAGSGFGMGSSEAEGNGIFIHPGYK